MGGLCAQVEGYNLQAATRIGANDRQALERMARYLSRPPIATDRLSQVEGRSAGIAAQTSLARRHDCVPLHAPRADRETRRDRAPPARHLTRYHGVLAPAFAGRSEIVPSKSAGD